MRGMLTLGAALTCAAALAACSGQSQKAAAPAPPQPEAAVKTTSTPTSVTRTAAVTATATVTAIDQKRRMVTLRTADGKESTFKVSDEVRNLPQVKKGDEVTATYYESLAIEVMKPGGKLDATSEGVVARAEPGELPGGAAARTTTITAKVMAVDRAKGTVTLKGPEGNSVTVKAADPANLEKVKKGDNLKITYTEALAVAVEPTGRKSK